MSLFSTGGIDYPLTASTWSQAPPLTSIAGIADAYRIVSFSFQITYTASLLNSSGSVNAAIFQQPMPQQSNFVKTGVDKSPFLYFGKAVEGCRLVYFPKDFGDTGFVDVGANGDVGSTMVAYHTGLPANTAFARLDMFVNVEYVPAQLVQSLVEMKKAASS